MKKFFIFLMLLSSFLFGETLNIYSDMTMKNAIKDLEKEFEKNHPGVQIRTLLGRSDMLLKKLKITRRGDLYFPGSPKFILNNKEMFSNYKEIGFNQIKIFVKKGNPKRISKLRDFLRPDVRVGLADKRTGVGVNSREVLVNYGGESFLKKVEAKAKIAFTAPALANQLKNGLTDTNLNWKSMLKYRDNEEKLQTIDIPEKYAPKKKLFLAVTSFSKNKKLANEFLDFAASAKGQEIMAKWGFK